MTPNVFPCLRYRDAPAAIDWLERAFGFTRGLVVPDGAGGVAHAQLRLGDGMVMLGSVRGGEGDAVSRALDATRGATYVRVADVEAHCSRAVAAGATILAAPNDTEYGAREYAALDPEGHFWSFGSYDPYGD